MYLCKFVKTRKLRNKNSHPILKATTKFKNHQRVPIIKNFNNGSSFHFCGVGVQNIIEEIMRLKS